MHNLLTLLKYYFKMYFGSFKRKNNKKSYVYGALVVALGGLLFIGLFTGMAITTIQESLREDINQPDLVLYVITSLGLVFMFLTVILKGCTPKRGNDASLLLSMPIKKHTIITAKLLRDLVFDFGLLLVTMMPGYICYFIMVNRNPLVIVMGIVVILLLTLIADSLSIFLRTIIFNITKNLRNSDVIQTIITVVITLTFLVFYYWFNNQLNNINTGFAEKFYNTWFLQLLISVIKGESIINFLILLTLSILVFIIGVIFLVNDFSKQKKSYHSKSKEHKYVQNKVTKMLFKNEIGRYFRSTTYVVNTIIGAFFIILFAGLVAALGPSFFTNAFSTAGLTVSEFQGEVLVIFILSLIAGTVITTSASISIEGKNFWILKVNPIEPLDIFKAKLKLNYLVGIIPSILGGIVVSIRFGNLLLIPFAIILPSLCVIFSAINGLLNNISYYRFDWQEEQEIIKQGMAILLSLTIGIAPMGIITIAYIATLKLSINPYILLCISMVIMASLDLIVYNSLKKSGVRKFKNIYE